MPIVWLAVICNSKRAKAKWFVQKIAGSFIKPCQMWLFSIWIILSIGLAVANRYEVVYDT